MADLEPIVKATQTLDRVCQEQNGRLLRCIPVRATDDDVVIADGLQFGRQRITQLEAELACARAEAQAARDWIEREWKALSKSGSRGGHRAAALTILEADLDAAREGGAHG